MINSTTTIPEDYTLQPETRARDLSHIPGTNGPPFVGNLPRMVKDFHGTVEKQYQKYGEVSRLGMGFVHKGLLILGPDNYKRMLLDQERNFSAKMGYAGSLGPFYGGGLLTRDYDEHRHHRRVFQTSFKNDAMRGYADMMNPIMATHLEQWSKESSFLFFPHIKEVLLDVAASIFFGIDDLGDDGKKLNQALTDISEKGMMGIVQVDLPGFKFHQGMNAKRYACKFIIDLIPERRAGAGKDFMSYMVKEKNDDGEYFSDQELAEHLAFLMFAAHDTTTSALSHLVMLLGQHPEIQNKVREELAGIGKDYLEYEDLDNLPYFEQAFYESLRLYPSVSMMTRRTIRECEMGGFRIPANTVLMLPPRFNHTMEQWWDEPKKFDPDRFGPERLEHKRHPFMFHPFGGGAHKCIGMHFAVMNAKCFMHQFLRRYEFKTPPNYNPWMHVVPMPRPGDFLPLELKKLG
jgi:cytochrome P450